MFYLQLVLAGIATGCIYSLAGMGVVLTYKATGVFNFAHGAVAMVVAYTLWQMHVDWGWPLWPSAALSLLVIGPGIGLLLERLVFGPLQIRGASTSEKLVATLGVFTLLLGAAFVIWTGTVRQGPRLVSGRSLDITDDLLIGFDQLMMVVLVLAFSGLVWGLFRHTHLGTEIRAVVDRRELAELAAVDSRRVAGIAWAMGCGFAGLTGVLLAPSGLDPFHLTLLVLETFSIAVVARLTSLPVAVGAGILLLGVGQALLTEVHVLGAQGVLGRAFEELKPNLSVILLFAALLLYRRLDVVGEDAGPARVAARRRPIGRTGPASWAPGVAVGVVFVALPFFLSDATFAYGHRLPAMVIILVSIVCVTGYSGQITLGQAAFAGFGAFLSARVNNTWGVPVLLSMLVGAAGAVVVGLAAGLPAVRRRGLFLGLTTLALGLLVYNVVFQSTVFAGGRNGLRVVRPSLFGWSLDGPYAFYYFELVVMALMLLLARNLRSGRLGRVLAAVRDSETAARSVGIDLRTYKLFIFGASAFIAGVGGALLTQEPRTFNAFQFNPLTSSLFWFMVVIVAGVHSISGAIVGAFVFVMLDVVVEVQGLSQLVIGIGALSLGFLPGGNLVGLFHAVAHRAARGARRAYADAAAAGVTGATGATGAAAAPAYAPSPLALRALAGELPGEPAGRATAEAAR